MEGELGGERGSVGRVSRRWPRNTTATTRHTSHSRTLEKRRGTTTTQMSMQPSCPLDSLTPPDGLHRPRAARSHYHLSREEWIQGIANRFVFSQIYLYLYLSMAILSVSPRDPASSRQLTTVILSLLSECPTLAFYVLEIVVNLAMILEVMIRLLAFGKQFWKSPFNWLDLMITGFCVVTVGVILVQGCKAKKEEVLDTFLLVIRNGIQFFRLALMLRRCVPDHPSRPLLALHRPLTTLLNGMNPHTQERQEHIHHHPAHRPRGRHCPHRCPCFFPRPR
ncbi:hypothetical protein VP01_1076g3 [Puccinia sorghi]|uniref:Ion transport domain-containing protein n=1 Tax=Puccinia sorghi TaxID=27349 RepID=A0A0L6VUX9_9BASI|nr:hypothetical protein VP01_1076g3 [Puccinia sorghi]